MLDDWAAHLIWAEKNLKELERRLLHKEYADVQKNIDAVKHSLGQVEEWVAKNREQ